MTLPQQGKIRYRRGPKAMWLAKDPVIDEGEPVYETDTKRWKLGDGKTRYSELKYRDLGDEAGITQADLNAHIYDEAPHPNYDDGRSLIVLYENAKV